MLAKPRAAANFDFGDSIKLTDELKAASQRDVSM